jgi:hypothetical protein
MFTARSIFKNLAYGKQMFSGIWIGLKISTASFHSLRRIAILGSIPPWLNA